MAEVGFARGNVSPIIYFENASGELMMPVYQAGHPEQARQVYEARYKDTWQWREAGTWAEVTRLQKRLIDQEERRQRRMSEADARNSGPVRERVNAALRSRMASAACSSFEREFIARWLQLREDKRKVYEQRFLEHQSYLWAVEMNDSTKIEDRMPMQEGEFWRA